MSNLTIVKARQEVEKYLQKPRAKRRPKMTLSVKLFNAELQIEELKRKLAMENERADNLSVKLDEFIADRDENYILIDSDNIATGDDVVMSSEDAEKIELLEDLKLARERYAMGILSEEDTIRNLEYKLL